MDYFEEIRKSVEEIDKLANAYLDKFEFISNEEMGDRIHAAAYKIFKGANEDWNSIPDWVASCMDFHVPYMSVSQNGSIFYALAFSCTSRDAHLRNLLEIAEGREEKELDFPVVAPNPVVEEESLVKKKKRKIKDSHVE